MKRLFFFLIVAVACVLPQSVWADNEASLDDETHTLTINSSAAGNLSKSPNSAIANFPLGSGVPTTVTKIVLKGKFNADDLSVISNNAGFDHVTVVDMEDAQFVRTISSTGGAGSYKLFKNITNTSTMDGALGANFGDRAILNGTLYVSARTPVWTSMSSMSPSYPAEGTTVYEISSPINIEGRSIGDYGKVKKTVNDGYVYIQMTVGAASWSTVTTQSTSNATEATSKVSGITEGNMGDYLSSYDEGETVWFWRYYQCQQSEENWVWNTTPTTESVYNAATGSKYDNPYGVNLDNLDNNYAGEGNVMRVKVYYTKNVERTWSSPQTEKPSGTIHEVDGDYVYHDNHKTGYYSGDTWIPFNNGDWVKLIDYDYYVLQATGNWRWEQTEYNNGSSQFINVTCNNISSAAAPYGANQYAIVLGTEYYYNGTNWTEAVEGSEVSDYSQMKFKWWKNSLVTATTSRYADESIPSDIFEECKSITHINYLGGNVTGLRDRTKGSGNYADFTVTIGKDVTKIQFDAFAQSPALTGIDFGGYADGDEESRIYPKELRIENQAFMECTYLTSITIPNRVTYIGSNAFKHVGNNSITDKNNIGNYNGTFNLTFERRRRADDSNIAIECDFPLTIDNSAFFDCWYLRDLSLPIRLEKLGEDCFKNTYNLKTVVMREEINNNTYTAPDGHDLLRTIPSGAFENSAVEELTIPQCVTLIENHAFGDTEHLKKVVFQNNSETNATLADRTLVIKSGAFTGGKEEGRPQLDVYVMVDPQERKIVCEYQAFNFTQTVGQTSVSNTSPSFAYLHFPEEAWDYYQGNWKRGLAFRQDNLNAFKDGYNRDNDVEPDYIGKSKGEIDRTTGKYETGTNATIYTPGNGWQEFARTSTTIDIVIPNTGSFLRTYSTSTAKAIPLYAEDDSQQGVHQGDPFFKVYRISHFDDGWQEGDQVTGQPSTPPTATATEVKLHYDGNTYDAGNYENAYIPAHTGLLMVGYGSGSVSYIVYMNDVTSGANTTYPFTANQKETVEADVAENTNLLFPSCDDDGVGTITTQGTENGVPYVYLNPTYPYPYNTSTNPLQFRFFGLGNRTVDGNKEYYFGRFAPGGKATRDKAYLRLTNEVFHWRDGSIGSQKVDPNANPSAVNPSRVALNFFDDEEESGTTGIKQVDTTIQRTDSNVFYTLEGVRLNSRPTQRGIYIHNGRKVVIK